MRFDFICMVHRPCAWCDNGTGAIPALKDFLKQWLSAPAGSMYRFRMAKNCMKEMRPADAECMIHKVMTLFRNHRNDEDVLEDAYLFDPLADPVNLMSNLVPYGTHTK
jgi:hypothetical protein